MPFPPQAWNEDWNAVPRVRRAAPSVDSQRCRTSRENRRMADSEPLVLTDVRAGVGWLTLNNATVRNTLTAKMVAGIDEAMDAFAADEGVGAVVVTGAGSAFCAGANLGNLETATAESLGNIYEGFLRVARSPLPT